MPGAITCVVVNPFWMVRNKQVSADAAGASGSAASAAEVLASIVRDGGPLALLTGVRASLLNTFEGAIQWTLLAQLQTMYTSSVWADFGMCIPRARAKRAAFFVLTRNHTSYTAH